MTHRMSEGERMELILATYKIVKGERELRALRPAELQPE